MLDDPSPVAVVGLGGFGRELVALIASGRTSRPWHLQAIMDDDETQHGVAVAGVVVTGPSTSIRQLRSAVVVAVGSPANRHVRRRVVNMLDLPDERYATIIAADAYVGHHCRVGVGSVLMPYVACTADVTIGRHTNVMPNCTLTHDVQVGDFVAIGSGVQLAGGTTVGDEAYVGSGVLVREHVRVGARTMIGMGSVVLSDVPDGEVWAGNPARRLQSKGELV